MTNLLAAPQIYLGSAAVVPTALRRRSNVAPLFFSASVNWSDYLVGDGMACRLIIPPASALEVRSVHIDNSSSPAACTLIFPDTGFMVQVPPFGAVDQTVISQGNEAILYSDRPPFVPNITGKQNVISRCRTDVFILNIELPPQIIDASNTFSTPYRSKPSQYVFDGGWSVAVSSATYAAVNFSGLDQNDVIDIIISLTFGASTIHLFTDLNVDFLESGVVKFTCPYTMLINGPTIGNISSTGTILFPLQMSFSNNSVLPVGAPPIENWRTYQMRVRMTGTTFFPNNARVAFFGGCRMFYPAEASNLKLDIAGSPVSFPENSLTNIWGRLSGGNTMQPTVTDWRIMGIGSSSAGMVGVDAYIPSLTAGEEIVTFVSATATFSGGRKTVYI